MHTSGRMPAPGRQADCHTTTCTPGTPRRMSHRTSVDPWAATAPPPAAAPALRASHPPGRHAATRHAKPPSLPMPENTLFRQHCAPVTARGAGPPPANLLSRFGASLRLVDTSQLWKRRFLDFLHFVLCPLSAPTDFCCPQSYRTWPSQAARPQRAVGAGQVDRMKQLGCCCFVLLLIFIILCLSSASGCPTCACRAAGTRLVQGSGDVRSSEQKGRRRGNSATPPTRTTYVVATMCPPCPCPEPAKVASNRNRRSTHPAPDTASSAGSKLSLYTIEMTFEMALSKVPAMFPRSATSSLS